MDEHDDTLWQRHKQRTAAATQDDRLRTRDSGQPIEERPESPESPEAVQVFFSGAERLVNEKDSYLTQFVNHDQQLHEEVSSQLDRLVNALKVNRTASHHFDEQVTTELGRIRQEVSAATLQARQERHQVETRLEWLGDSKLAEVRGLTAEDRKVHAGSVQYAKSISDEVSSLYHNIEKARQFRIEQGQALAQGVRLKLEEVGEAISAESRIRQESQNTLLELFGQMGQKCEQEMENARRERHLCTDRLIHVMEDLLPRMDEAYRRGVEKCRESLTDQCGARDMATTATTNFKNRRSVVSMKRGGTFSFKGSIAAV